MSEWRDLPVAIWFRTWDNRIDFDLDDTEQEIAEWAVAQEDSDYPSTILGVQFKDGRTITAREWPALAEARRRARQAEQDRRDNPLPPTPKRTVHDPFTGSQVQIEADDPDWLGT
jgi:hypothetical protein